MDEQQRLFEMTAFERQYEPSYDYIGGIDEAGRGPLAGPVVAACVILPKGHTIRGVNDSKKISEKKREKLYDVIIDEALAVGVGIVGPDVIDEINILQATYSAMRDAIADISIQPDILLCDAVKIPEVDIPQVPIVKGDAKSLTIAAASIIAKVTRDRIMRGYDEDYPEWNFGKHKGYGTAAHYAAIREHGISPIHRKTFLKKMH